MSAARPSTPRSILFLNHNFRNRGTFFRNFQLARALVKRGWRAEVWTVSPTRSLFGTRREEDGVAIWETPQWTVPRRFAESGCCGWDIAARTVTLAREVERFDVVFVSDHLFNVSLPYFAARSLARARGHRLITIADWADLFTMGGLHENWARGATWPLYQVEHRLELATKAGADLCTVISHALGERLRSHVPGVDAARIHHLPSGCDPTTPWWPTPVEARARVPALADRRDAFIIGRIASGPGMQEAEARALFTAADRYAQLHRGARPVLLWVGPRLAEDDRAKLALAYEVIETGVVPPGEVPALAGSCDLFLLMEDDTPQNRSRNPTRLTSYLAAGRAVALSPFSDSAPELVAAGAAVAWEDPATPPPALDLLLRDPSHRQELGRRARHIAETTLAWETLADGLLRRLEPLLS